MEKEKDVEKKAEAASTEVKAEKATKSESTEVKDEANKVESVLDKKCGKFSIKQIIIAVLCVVVLLVVLKGVMSLFSSDTKVPDYQVVYANSDGDLMVASANGKNEVKLSSDGDGAIYANTTDRYILFAKGDARYLYDKKHPEDSQKVGKDISDAGFSADDKMVWYLNADGELYSYKKESKKIDSDVEDVVKVTATDVIYTKDSDDGVELYIRDLKAKKDKKKIANDIKKYYVSEKANTVVYRNADNELHLYKISGKKDTKIVKDIVSIEDVSADLSVIYATDEDNNIYYIKGTKSTKIAEEVDTIKYYNAEDSQIVYVVDDMLYYKKADKKEVKVTDSEKIGNVTIFDKTQLYYLYKEKDDKDVGELYYSKLSDNKATSPKSVADDVYTMSRVKFNKGLIVYTGVKDSVGEKNVAVGELNVVKNGKIQKVTEDVYVDGITPSLDNNKIYFLGDYDDGEGSLMSTTGKKAKSLVENVSDYDYVKENMIYVALDKSSKGKFDLGCYNGHKVIKVAESVKGFIDHPSNKKGATYDVNPK